MSSTKNTKDNRQVVRVTYSTPESIFEIPDGLDLEDKSVVEDWGVKYNELRIIYVNGKEERFAPRWDAADDQFQHPKECEIVPAEDTGYEYEEESESEEEEESEHCCYGCKFEGLESCFMIDEYGYMYCYSCVHYGNGKFSNENREKGSKHYVKVWCIQSDSKEEE